MVKRVLLCSCAVTLLSLCFASVAGEGTNYKRDDPDPNLFWANRGKKSLLPYNHEIEEQQQHQQHVNQFSLQQQQAAAAAAAAAQSPAVYMPHRIFGLYLPKRTSSSYRLRPNGNLLPLTVMGKRAGQLTMSRPNSQIFPPMFGGKGKKSDAIYPSQLETFYAGRGKRDFSGAWGQMPQAFESLNLEPTDLDNLMAGRGKKAGSNNNNNAVDDVMTFYAGRGKRDTRSIDSKDDIESKNVFFALRG